MIGLSILGALIFWISDLMYAAMFNILIKILEGLLTSNPNNNNIGYSFNNCHYNHLLIFIWLI